jgi:hypothetical protein
MRVRLVRRPGQHGTKAYVEQYGDRLICVRYRYDEATRRRYKTIELIVEETPWKPKREAQAEKQVPLAPSDKATIAKDPPKPQQPKPIPPGKLKPGTFVGVKVSQEDVALSRRLEDTGAIWLPNLKVWQLTYAQAVALRLTNRIIGTIGDIVAARTHSDRHR